MLFAPIVAEPAYDVEPVASAFLIMHPYHAQDRLGDEISAVIKDGRLVDRGAGGFRQLLEEPSRARMLAPG